MKGKSILLALNGSQQSHFAADVCWRLSKRLNAHVTAQHVVDSHSAWEFLGHDKPGFLTADDFIEGYKGLMSSLFDISERLAEAYLEEARNLNIDTECVVDHGNPITEICRRSANYKLVVIGHRAGSLNRQTRSQFQRLSVAEALAHDCPRPLLVVQGLCKEWSSFSIIISPDHINEIFINSCLDMANALRLPAILICVTGGQHEEKPGDLVADLRASNKRLAELPVALMPVQSAFDLNSARWYVPEGSILDESYLVNPLLAIPTRMIGGERLTVIDSSPSTFVRYLDLPSILLWPEEFAYAQEQEKSASLLSKVH